MKMARKTLTAFEAPVEGRPDLLIIAGEHSGDEHAAEMLAEMRAERPDLKIACMGGAKLEAAGAQLIYDLTAISVVGFYEVAKHYLFFKKLFGLTLDWIERYQPRHICFVDYPGFNLRLASELQARGLSRKGGGSIGISYYIGPQVWAWKAKRRFKMAQTIDRLSVIFPFEVDCYKDTDLPVEYVVHPFLQAGHKDVFYYDDKAPVLLLPGSRSAACSRIFPVLLSGFAEARKTNPDLRAQVIFPSKQIGDLLLSILEQYPDLKDSVALMRRGDTAIGARATLMSSGTMSLSVALSGIPGAIAYRMNPITYWLGRIFIKIEFLGIANILLRTELYPEYIQQTATSKQLGEALIHACRPEAVELNAKAAKELKASLNPQGAQSPGHWLLRGLD